MDKPKAVLFFDICRLCLENPGMDDVFSKTGLVHDIFLCTGVNIGAPDKLPRKICIQCLEIVVKAKRLRILATANATHLQSLFNDEDDDDIFGITDQTLTENIPNSRRSSTDSDRTVKLEIVTNDADITLEEETSQSKKRKISDSSSSSNDSKPKGIKISVRKDLFDSSGAVTSSTKDPVKSTKDPVKSTIDPVKSIKDPDMSAKDPDTSVKDPVSSTKDPVMSIKQKLKVKIKRIKTEDDDSFHYVCVVCEKKFDAWKKFYLHQKQHNRNIMCPLDACGKKFATKGDLEKHVRTHTGERPYSCDLCDRRFAQRGSLKAHKQALHSPNGTPEKLKKS